MSELKNLTKEDVYSAEIAALAINFGECIYDEGVENESEFDRRLLAALEVLGYTGLNIEKLNLTTVYYLSPDSPVYGQCVDLTELPEYSVEFPYSDDGES